jgi:hypothetical protein
MLAIAVCGGLAACGGVHAQYSAAYDPNSAVDSGPVAVTVVGPSDTGISQAAVASAANGALRNLGVDAREASMAGNFDAMSTRGVVADASDAPDVSEALRARGVHVGQVGIPDTGYHLTVLYGPIAESLAKASDRDYGQGLCTAINGQSTAAIAASNGGSVDGTPVLAVLCKQNTFQTMAYEKLAGTGSVGEYQLQARMETLITHVLPSSQMLGRDLTPGGG